MEREIYQNLAQRRAQLLRRIVVDDTRGTLAEVRSVVEEAAEIQAEAIAQIPENIDRRVEQNLNAMAQIAHDQRRSAIVEGKVGTAFAILLKDLEVRGWIMLLTGLITGLIIGYSIALWTHTPPPPPPVSSKVS